MAARVLLKKLVAPLVFRSGAPAAAGLSAPASAARCFSTIPMKGANRTFTSRANEPKILMHNQRPKGRGVFANCTKTMYRVYIPLTISASCLAFVTGLRAES